MTPLGQILRILVGRLVWEFVTFLKLKNIQTTEVKSLQNDVAVIEGLDLIESVDYSRELKESLHRFPSLSFKNLETELFLKDKI